MNGNQKYVCPKCNGLVDYGVRFCPHCGNAFGSWGAPVQSSKVNSGIGSNNYAGAAASREESFKEMFFSSEGRLNRKATFERLVINGIGCQILAWFMAKIALELGIIGIIISLAAYLVLLYSGICISIRRWHDLNKSGWYVLSIFLILPIFYFWFAKGTEGPNKYGPDPLAGKN